MAKKIRVNTSDVTFMDVTRNKGSNIYKELTSGSLDNLKATVSEVTFMIDNKNTFIDYEQNHTFRGFVNSEANFRNNVIITLFNECIRTIDDIKLNGSQGHRLEYYINSNLECDIEILKHLRGKLLHKMMYNSYIDKDEAKEDIILFKSYDSVIQMKTVLGDDDESPF